jgi:hypothetical protein
MLKMYFYSVCSYLFPLLVCFVPEKKKNKIKNTYKNKKNEKKFLGYSPVVRERKPQL